MTDKKKKKRGNLPEHCLGQMRNPEIRAKAQATRAKNLAEKKARKEAAETGFSRSVASDPEAQAALINRLYKFAMDDDLDLAKWAIKMLNDMNVTKQVMERPTDEQNDAKKVDIAPEDALNILKAASKKNLSDLDNE